MNEISFKRGEEIMSKIKCALISVSDKTGVVEFARGLSELGIEIISTGGTARELEKANIKVKQISDYTGYPELLGGRVKTLHPKVHAALLALRDKPEQLNQIKKHDIKLIDLVVVNLYPFSRVVGKSNVVPEEIIENIDIGGVTLLRSAAKNYKDVAVTVNPQDYLLLLEELRKNNNEISGETKLRLAKEAFKHTAKYDYTIYSYFYKLTAENTKINDFPDLEKIRLEKIQDLRYGENPHQRAAFYKELKVTNGEEKTGVVNMEQLHGKELSFNNIIDLESAWDITGEFNSPAAIIIKHTNPCGVATGTKLIDAYQNARKCDPVSAFGSIVGFNREVDKDVADEISKTFVECVIAPSFSEEALQVLRKKKNIRLIKMPEISGSNREFDYKKISGGLLIQEKNTDLFKGDLTVVTKRKPAEDEMKALQFAWKVCKHVKSNAIVYTTGDRTIGIGAGQMSRVDSAQLAIMKANNAGLSTKGCVLASDAFFPFRDGIDAAARAGITAIIQPGGSVRDDEVINACNEYNIAMVFTGMRHFKH